jgi:glycosyltransferase involved in cell wall biosynthesis
MKRIAYLVPYAEPGGGERLIAEFCRRIDRGRFQPVVILPQPGRLVDLLRASNTEVLFTPFRRDFLFGYPPAIGLGAAGRIGGLLRDNRIDLLHLNDSYLTLLGALAARKAGIPVVLTAHGTWDAHFLLQDILNRAFLERIWTPHNGVRMSLLRRRILPPDRVKIVHFGVDTGRFQPLDRGAARASLHLPPDAMVIARVARFDKAKDYPTLLRAAEKVALEFPKALFVIVGDRVLDIPSEKAHYKEDAVRFVETSAALRDRVRFAGYQDDVRPFLAAADVLVSSSASESMPINILEAMAMGRAVVSTAVGGIAEVVDAGVTGLLVPAGNAAELATALLDLAGNPNRREEMGAAALRRVRERFNLSTFVQSMEREYVDVFDARAAKHPAADGSGNK